MGLFDRFKATVSVPSVSRIKRLRDNPDYLDCTTTVDTLIRHHKPEMVYDIGAHNGDWSRILLESLKLNPKIVLFEPQLNNFNRLTELFGNTENKLFKVALGSKTGDMMIRGGGASASIMEADEIQNKLFPGSIDPSAAEKVSMVRLDDLVHKEHLPWADLIKIDVQGYELEVLAGATTALKQAKFLVIELSVICLYKGQPLLTEVIDFLSKSGFTLVDLGHMWRNQSGEIVQMDAVFKKI